MVVRSLTHLRSFLFTSPALLLVWLGGAIAHAQTPSRFYKPIPLTSGNEISDQLSNKDIPTGQGGFARDYEVELSDGDQVAIDLTSDDFDTIVSLLSEDGSTIAENDDGPDGTTNSLLFTRIVDAGTYVIRVRAFGETNGGKYTLKITRLKPI